MRSKRSRRALVGISALALSAFAVPGAQAAKVTEKASGGAVPDAIDIPAGPTISGEFTQSFKLSGKNVKKKQVLDVNVIVNTTDVGASSFLPVSVNLIAPKGDNDGLAVPGLGASNVNVKLDQQSDLFACNPFDIQRSNCNYLQGGNAAGTTGVMTGSIDDSLNQEFKGLNPKGTWKVLWQDNGDDNLTVNVGEVTLEVKTGKKFAKES